MINFTGIKTIFWDFDGVIMDSMPIRDQGFLKVLKDYPEKQVNKLIAYHKANGGLSRYVKFRYFFEEIRKEDVSDEEIQELAMRFSLIMLENLKKPEFLISQTVNFIKHTYENYKMFIVSGSDQKELRQICKAVEIEKFFKGIYGSPTAKDELVKHLIDTENIESATSILIGDSVNDFEAAKVNGIKFYGFNNPALTTVSKNYISKFS
ncbi:HAD family hydrolase [Marivirga atlantica]|jgi:HAD superfamily hydrolase (TIGR01549 family)|uniref:phosphoglycolate phosphatase n=1 Tax=Marivirga atlantica TaxID=1548457 RepID=A0A937DFQ4_9BACT|nr:HAD hydrolase-like protein [Marivirga atlantica]MBL0766442.1 HAD family hydrolase [Marivirga atlantica]